MKGLSTNTTKSLVIYYVKNQRKERKNKGSETGISTYIILGIIHKCTLFIASIFVKLFLSPQTTLLVDFFTFFAYNDLMENFSLVCFTELDFGELRTGVPFIVLM